MTPSTLLSRAIDAAAAGRFAEARRDVAAAVERGRGHAVVHLVAGMVLYVCRNHDAALRAFERAAEVDPRATRRASGHLIQRAARLEWSHEIRACVARAIADEPDEVRFRLESLRLHSNARDWDAALREADGALAIDPRLATVHMERGAIEARLGHRDEALASARRAVELRPELTYRLEAARIAMDVGDYALSETLYEEAERDAPGDPQVAAARGRLALFWGRLDDADAHARAALARAPEMAAALRVSGAVAVLREDWANAMERLDDALRVDPEDYEAWVWRAEVHTRAARIDEAFEDLHRATMRSDGYLLPGLILKSIAHFVKGDRYEANRLDEIAAGVSELVPERLEDLFSGDHLRVRSVLEEAMVRLAGNRTTMPSRLFEGRLTRLETRTSPRHGSRWALELVRTAEPETAMRELDRMVERFPKSSLPICHRGELKLWLGDLAGARADLEAAIAILPETRWAWIGLTGVDTLEGHPARALETSARGVRTMADTTGYSVYAYRADALRRLGRLEEAEADLRLSIGHNRGQRLGAWVILGLVHADRGDAEGLWEVWRRVEKQAVGLLSCAAAELGVELWPERDALPEPELARRVLDHALHMMRGNRSSTCVTFLTSKGDVRYVPRYPHQGRGPHDTDADDLRKAAQLLRAARGSVA